MDKGPTRGWVLYDDSCGFCQRWISFWTRLFSSLGFATAPLQAEWVRQYLGESDAELLQDLRLLLADGRQVRGADVYRYVTQRVWWAYPLYLFSIAPFGRQAFDWGYHTFARNRLRVSRVCRLQAGSNRPAESGGVQYTPLPCKNWIG